MIEASLARPAAGDLPGSLGILERKCTMRRRTFIRLAGTAGVSAAAKLPALAASVKVTAGYVHTVAVDGQLWLASSLGLFERQDLDMHFVEFQNGIEAFQAMAVGSLDVLATGAVISHYPAIGQGKVFLINDIEYATAQLWCHPEMGVESIADLKGRKVATSTGTTAHVFLDIALRENGINPADVLIINERMPDAVTSFISKAVPAIALWVPHNNLVKERSPTARMLADASAYFPKAAIVNGWAARNGFYKGSKDVLSRIVRAWARANDFMASQPERAVAMLHDKYYPAVPPAELRQEFNAQKMFSSRAWLKMYVDGTVARWLQRVTDFYTTSGIIGKALPAAEYLDTSIYTSTINPRS